MEGKESYSARSKAPARLVARLRRIFDVSRLSSPMQTALILVQILALMTIAYKLSAAHVTPPPVNDAAMLQALRPRCVVQTCTSIWGATTSVVDTNQDNAGCSTVRSMVNITAAYGRPAGGHWCKALRAVKACDSRRYRFFVFRDDDTIVDVAAVLDELVQSRMPLLASYKSHKKRIVTNWFAFDTRNRSVCDRMRRWWKERRYFHPEHDQYFFNDFFKCGVDGVHCVDKREGKMGEVHCRSSLGPYHAKRRQECMRYQIHPKPELL